MWIFKLPEFIRKEPFASKVIYYDCIFTEYYFDITKKIFKDIITYYELEFTPLPNAREEHFRKSAYGFEPKYTNVMFKDIIYRLTKYQIIYIRYMEKYKGEEYVKLKDMDKIFLGKNKYKTFYSAACNLHDKYNRYLKVDFLKKEVYEFMQEIDDSSIRNFKVIFDDEISNKLNDLENNLILLRLRALFDMANALVTISHAEKETKVNAGTIKHACQTGKLINTKKVGKTWLVDIDEIIDMIENKKNEQDAKIAHREVLKEIKAKKKY